MRALLEIADLLEEASMTIIAIIAAAVLLYAVAELAAAITASNRDQEDR